MSDHRTGTPPGQHTAAGDAGGGRPRIGSLCTGYGGLDLAVEWVLGGRLAWYAETDPHARTVCEHRWPGVVNHGDIRTTDWSTVEPVEILTAGFPCQDFPEGSIIPIVGRWMPSARVGVCCSSG